jgi:hypothetical protein
MFERIFSAALAFCALAGGTLAIGAALFELDRPALHGAQAARQVLWLPSVEVVAPCAQSLAGAASAEPAPPRLQ